MPVVTQPVLKALQRASVLFMAEALVQTLALQLVAPMSPSQIPSDPIYPTQVMISPRKVEQAGNGEGIHPFPFVIQSTWYAEQSVSVIRVEFALLQIREVQLIPPMAPSQFPSVPFSSEQVTSFPEYELQAPRAMIQPFPVVTHP